jgi:hypothetical protein
MAGMANRVILITDEGLSEEDKILLRRKFADGDEVCRWCGGLHRRECPRVRKIIFNPADDRAVREVEFWNDMEYDRSSILWPEDCV